jgi:hypothetical protein
LREQGFYVKELDEHVEVYQDLRFAWSLFSRLSRSRNYGDYAGNPKPISVQDILTLFELLYVTDPQERLRLLDQIQILDETFIEYMAKKSKRKNSSCDQKGPVKGPINGQVK